MHLMHSSYSRYAWYASEVGGLLRRRDATAMGAEHAGEGAEGNTGAEHAGGGAVAFVMDRGVFRFTWRRSATSRREGCVPRVETRGYRMASLRD